MLKNKQSLSGKGRSMKVSVTLILIFLAVVCCDSERASDGSGVLASDTVKPEDNRFIPVTITPQGSLDEPMMFQLLRDGTTFIIERKGGFKKFDPVTAAVTLIATIPVFTGNEQGLIGLALDPNYENNHWVYLQFAPLNKSVFRLSRYDLESDRLIEESEKILLEIPVDRENTSHTGGGTAWDKDGNLYLKGNYKSMERFAPDYHPVQPLDIKFGPDGDLYLLEYGINPSRSSAESRLVRVEYHAGNRKPL